MRHPVVVPLLSLVACAHPAPPAALPEVAARQAAVDWDLAGREVTDLLASYLRVPTVNPPGDETLGARFLADVLAKEGIASEIVEYAPGRGSLIARLEGGDQPPLCLLSHLDVVPVEEARWTQPPFGGAIVDGYLYGRGALDMKSLGAVQVQTMILLKRQQVPLNRDVVLLAVADEEIDNTGIKTLAARWDTIGCSHVINEGGIGIRGALVDDQLVYPISITEKGNLWVRMIATGTPGHGSTPKPDQAPDRLARAVERLLDHQADVDIQPAMLEMFDRVGRETGGITGAVLRSPPLVRWLVKPKLLANPVTQATITDTINLTGFGGAREPNVIPAEVFAQLDCRLLPGTTPDEMLARLAAIVDDPQIRFEVIASGEAVVTPWEDPLFDALARNLVDGRDQVVAAPFISIGSTDSTYLRPLGVRAYGIAPFEVSADDLSTMHGDDERVPVAELRDGLRRFYGAVVEFAAAPPPTVP